MNRIESYLVIPEVHSSSTPYRYVIMRNVTPSLIQVEALGANVSKGGIYSLLLWLLLSSNDTSKNQSRHLVGPLKRNY